MFIFVFGRIILAAIITIITLYSSISVWVKEKNNRPFFITVICLSLMIFVLFYYGTIQTPGVTRDDILAFKEKIESIDKENFRRPIDESHLETLFEPTSYYIIDYSNREGVWAYIFIQEFDSFDNKKEFKNAEKYTANINAELLPSQTLLFKAKVERGEIDGVQYIIAPLESDFYEVNSYGGSVCLIYDSTTVLINYSVQAKNKFLSLFTHPKPIEWNLLQFLD